MFKTDQNEYKRSGSPSPACSDLQVTVRDEGDVFTEYQIAGYGLRELRRTFRLTLAQVEARSRRIAETRQNRQYMVTAGHISQIETGGCTLPSFYKLSSLAEIYQCSSLELLGLYGIEIDTRTGLPVKANRLDRARTQVNAHGELVSCQYKKCGKKLSGKRR